MAEKYSTTQSRDRDKGIPRIRIIDGKAKRI